MTTTDFVKIYAGSSVVKGRRFEICFNRDFFLYGITIIDEDGTSKRIAIDADTAYEMAMTIKENVEADE